MRTTFRSAGKTKRSQAHSQNWTRKFMKHTALILALVSVSALAHGETRLRLRFDDDWKFKKDAVAVRNVRGPFSWKWKPATQGTTLRTADLPADLDQGDWKPIELGAYVFRGGFNHAWYRTDIGHEPKNASKLIHFEAVDDNCAVFLNGVGLTIHRGWNDPFDVSSTTAWKPDGPNILTVLVQNTGGDGGIIGSVDFLVPQLKLNPAQAKPGFVDKSWRHVDLPHDYVVEGTFDRRADTSHGSLPTTPAWYRKTFALPLSYKGKSVWIDFDGVYRDSTVWLNGHELGHHPSGYIGFRHDLNKFANFGGKNVLAVRVDPTKGEGWWYEGGGIYRHVWLNVANPVHVQPWGVYVRTGVRGIETGLGLYVRASVHGVEPADPTGDLAISTTIVNDTGKRQSVVVTTTVYDPIGQRVATTKTTKTLSGGSAIVSQKATIFRAKLWSADNPNLYHMVTEVSKAGQTVDRVETPFGIRTLRWDKNLGFFLNEKPLKLQGTCNHQDHAGVGIAMPDSLLYWRIKKLKEMGSNAYRCSHNPPAAELLDACDRLGMVVMDETRHLGDTSLAKTPEGTKATDLTELKSMLLRDRNHPSVIMWSLANEEGLQGTDEGAQIFKAMMAVGRKLDPTRPATSAMNGGYAKGFTLVQDLQGFNYNIYAYDPIHKQFPNLPLYGSETASTVSTRGIYANDAAKGYVSAYDVNAPDWGATAEDGWRPIGERPYIAGGFVWTGFDYKGEPTPYGWPCINSHFGIIDIAGFPKDNFYYYKAWWGKEPVVHVLPHWNWKGQEGKPIDVWVYSNADRVELYLNGKKLGDKPMPKFGHVSWKVPYTPGVLIAKGYKGSKLIATDKVETTGAPAQIKVFTDRANLTSDNQDLSVVQVQILDAKGRVVPTASNLVKFSLKGTGRIAGVGNGDPSSHEPDKASRRSAFNGLCMALIQATHSKGEIVLTASSPGLKPATLRLVSAQPSVLVR